MENSHSPQNQVAKMYSDPNIKFPKSTMLLLSLCVTQQLYAQEADDHNVAQLPTIKVEATHTDTSYLQTPASVFRVDAPQQQNSLGVNLTEVLQGVPSVQLNNRENYAQDLQLSMRGFGARSTFGVRGIRLYSQSAKNIRQ